MPIIKPDTKTLLRIMKFRTGRRTIYSNSTSVLTQSPDQLNQENTVEQANTSSKAQSIMSDNWEREHIENTDVFKVRIWKRGMTKFRRIFKKLYELITFLVTIRSRPDYPTRARWEALRLGRELKSTELAQIRDEEHERKVAEALRPQVRIAERTIINTLDALTFRNDNPKAKNKHVRFDMVEFDSNTFRFHVDARRLPDNVNLPKLATPEVTTTLAGALWRPVNAILGDPLKQVEGPNAVYQGLWYEVEIAGTLGIPNRCEFRQMLELIPDSAHDLAFTLGYAESKRHVIRSLEPLPHLLITGETLGGKSNGINVIICCHISRNTPDQLRTLMIDVKGGGIELGHYEGIAHMITEVPGIPNGIARTSEQGLAVLEYVAGVSSHRMEDMTSHKIKKLSEWNRKYPKRKMPYIVVYIDELAELLDPQDRKLRNAVLALVKKLASTSRAAGVHLIGALQTADRTNMPQTIKNNFPGRLAFAMADASASILAIGDGSATNLSPVGRAIWKHGRDRLPIQTPYIASGEIAQIVENAKQGKVTAKVKRTRVTPEEIVKWSLEELESRLPVRETFEHFNQQGISARDIERILQEMEGQVYTVEGNSYRIIKSVGKNARTLEKLDEVVNVPENSRDVARDTQENDEFTEETEDIE
jgi:hypothetical protein